MNGSQHIPNRIWLSLFMAGLAMPCYWFSPTVAQEPEPEEPNLICAELKLHAVEESAVAPVMVRGRFVLREAEDNEVGPPILLFKIGNDRCSRVVRTIHADVPGEGVVFTVPVPDICEFRDSLESRYEISVTCQDKTDSIEVERPTPELTEKSAQLLLGVRKALGNADVWAYPLALRSLQGSPNSDKAMQLLSIKALPEVDADWIRAYHLVAGVAEAFRSFGHGRNPGLAKADAFLDSLLKEGTRLRKRHDILAQWSTLLCAVIHGYRAEWQEARRLLEEFRQGPYRWDAEFFAQKLLSELARKLGEE